MHPSKKRVIYYRNLSQMFMLTGNNFLVTVGGTEFSKDLLAQMHFSKVIS